MVFLGCGAGTFRLQKRHDSGSDAPTAIIDGVRGEPPVERKGSISILFKRIPFPVFWRRFHDFNERLNHHERLHTFGGSNMNDALHFADRIVLSCELRAVVVYEGDNLLRTRRGYELWSEGLRPVLLEKEAESES